MNRPTRVTLAAVVAASSVALASCGADGALAGDTDAPLTTVSEATVESEAEETGTTSETVAATSAEPATTTVTETATERESPGESSSSTPSRAAQSPASPGQVTLGGHTATMRACDGSGVMIIDSVIDDGTGSAEQHLTNVISANPGAEFYPPGMCPSLRGNVPEGDVYAVVYHFGHDIDALCSSGLGGNPRLLINQVDYSSPCSA